jgi:hypothetical protein
MKGWPELQVFSSGFQSTAPKPASCVAETFNEVLDWKAHGWMQSSCNRWLRLDTAVNHQLGTHTAHGEVLGVRVPNPDRRARAAQKPHGYIMATKHCICV